MSSQCARCGELNLSTATFCGKCGYDLLAQRVENARTSASVTSAGSAVASAAPAWSPHQQRQQQSPVSASKPPMSHVRHCPSCGTTEPPKLVKKMPAFGWFVLVCGLCFCLVGALACLLFIEKRYVCPVCGHQSSG